MQASNEPRSFERWADEGGVRIRFTETPTRGLVITILASDGQEIKATLANFRRDHLERWLAGESVQPY